METRALERGDLVYLIYAIFTEIKREEGGLGKGGISASFAVVVVVDDEDVDGESVEWRGAGDSNKEYS